MIDGMVDRLGEDAPIRATLRGEDAAAGARLLVRDAELLKSHLTKRRQFLLEQKEIQAAAPQSPHGGGIFPDRRGGRPGEQRSRLAYDAA